MLYEVITAFDPGRIGAIDQLFAVIVIEQIGIKIRITSYNVCYTKLLREIFSCCCKTWRQVRRQGPLHGCTGVHGPDE